MYIDPAAEKELVLNMHTDNILETEDTCFLVKESWWNEWYRYATEGRQKPGKMKNTELMNGFSIETKNTKMLNKNVWSVLCDIYDGKPDIEIFIIDKVPDYHPKPLYIRYPGVRSNEFFLVSLKITVQRLVDHIRSKKNVKYSMDEVWFDSKKLDPGDTLCKAGIREGNNIKIISYENVSEDQEEKPSKWMDAGNMTTAEPTNFFQNKNVNNFFSFSLYDTGKVEEMVNSALVSQRVSLNSRSLGDIQKDIDELHKSLDNLEIY